MKRPDPHEEALMLLKEQMAHLAAAPGTQVRAGWNRQGGDSEESQKPASSASHGLQLPSVGPTRHPLSTLFGVRQVSREAVALVKPVTSVPKMSMGPTPGERGGGVSRQVSQCLSKSERR